MFSRLCDEPDLLVVDRVHVQKMSHRKRREPQSYYCRTDGYNELSNAFVRRVCRDATPDAKALSKQACKQDCAADNKSNPSQSHMANPFTLLIRRLGSTFLTKYS
jgi:hypothetical protein